MPFIWVVHPSARPANLGDILIEKGFAFLESVPGMAMNLAELPPMEPSPDGFDVVEVTTQHQLLDAQELIAWRWHIPEGEEQRHREMTLGFGEFGPDRDLRCWIAYLNGEPMCKAILHLCAGSAGIHGVATKPEARGKGLGRHLTLTALHAARAAGYELGMLHSSAMARSLYQEIGFKQVSEFRVFSFGADMSI